MARLLLSAKSTGRSGRVKGGPVWIFPNVLSDEED